MNKDYKISFLKSSISDAQELIRFTENKTAFAITILGAFIVTYFTEIDKIVKYAWGYSYFFWFFLLLFLIFLVLCIIVITMIIKPINNPIQNIHLNNPQNSNLKYFLGQNDHANDIFYPFYNSKNFKLKENFDSYIEQLKMSDENDIINSLTLELFKVNYIRNIKNDRFNCLINLLILTAIFFFVSYFLFIFETQQILNYIESIKCHCCRK
jgi:predicted PurR-regulated permease PerM